MYIKSKSVRGKTFYIVYTEGGYEYLVFSRRERAEAWLRNEIYA
jgi:hypothetical protein